MEDKTLKQSIKEALAFLKSIKSLKDFRSAMLSDLKDFGNEVYFTITEGKYDNQFILQVVIPPSSRKSRFTKPYAFPVNADSYEETNSSFLRAIKNVISDLSKLIYSVKENWGLEEDMHEVKKYIVFDHFNPDTLYFVKNIPDDSWIWDSDYIIEDVTDKHGNCLIENNDEDISVSEMGNKTLSDFDKEIIASLKQAIQEDPDEEYLCAYTSDDREFCFEKDELPNDLDSMTPFTDFVENSYVDGDSNSQYQVINLDTEEFGEFGVDIFVDEDADYEDLDESFNKTYQITVKYHNEPNAKIEARSAKDRKDLEYQLNMDDEVEWYDFDEKQFTESVKEKIGPKSKQGILKIMDYLDGLSFEDLRKTSGGFAEDFPEVGLYFYFHDNDDVKKTFGVAELGSENFIAEEDIYSSRKSQANERDFNSKIKNIMEKVAEYFIANAHKLIEDCSLNESLDQMRQKAQELRKNSDAFAILYGYRVKDGKEVDLEPEEYATEEEYRDRIQLITDSFTMLIDNDPRGNRYGHEHNITFYTVYPNKKQNVTENASKWNIGSDKSNLTSGEIALLDELAQKLESSSVNGYKYAVQHTYEDFGANMQWYTIVCYSKKGDSWQVLNPKEWLQLMNTGDVDAVYNDVISDEYFQDKIIKESLAEMNHRQLMHYMDTLD